MSEESRTKVSASKKGHKLPPHTEEQNRKQSERQKGRKQSPEHYLHNLAHLHKLQEAQIGQSPSEETRKKISETLKQRFARERLSKKQEDEAS